MNYNIQNFISEISIVISEVEKELLNRKKGIQGDGNYQQLEFIKTELVQIRNQAQTNTLLPRDKRYTAFSRYVVDEWDTGSVLGRKLCDLANKYKKKL